MTPEEMEEYENSIPEWKKGALTVSDTATEEEKKGMFGRLGDRINDTGAGKKFFESDEYQRIKEARGSYSEFKNKLSDGVENT